jgi:peptidoglycan/LPS O-acetylase OafA/YrhL
MIGCARPSQGTPVNAPAIGLKRIPWLDVARLLAMAMVAVQHSLSVCDINPSRVFFHLDPGQFGVAMFFSISGFFVVQGRTTNVGPWLRKRLSRIFVPYWITVTAVLIANHLRSYKPVSVWLVVSEYFGLAGWTHRGQIVGVHLWFVSLLLFW